MSIKDSCVCAWETLPITLANGSSVSDAVNLGGLRLFGIVMPSAWTTANLTFQMSPDGGTTWADLYDNDGNEIVAAANTSSCIILTPEKMAALQHLRVRSGLSSAPVAQGAVRSLQLILRMI